MKESIEKFGCFLTGFNYQIIKACSEVAKKMLKRYTGLLILISIVWAVIGYSFAVRYLKLDTFGAVIMSIICVMSIIMIERNIILAHKGSKSLYAFRMILAFIMAIVGSLILDQIMFAEDIDQKRISVIAEKVKADFPIKSSELKEQISNLNEQIASLESRQQSLSDEVGRNPTIKSYTRSTTTLMQPGDSVPTRNTTSIVNDVANPKLDELNNVQDLLKSSYEQRQQKDSLLLELRASLQKEYENRRGFLDELSILFDVISQSTVSCVVYLMWLVLFLAIEMFIVFSKIYEQENDYHKLVEQQMQLHIRRLNLLVKD